MSLIIILFQQKEVAAIRVSDFSRLDGAFESQIS